MPYKESSPGIELNYIYIPVAIVVDDDVGSGVEVSEIKIIIHVFHIAHIFFFKNVKETIVKETISQSGFTTSEVTRGETAKIYELIYKHTISYLRIVVLYMVRYFTFPSIYRL